MTKNKLNIDVKKLVLDRKKTIQHFVKMSLSCFIFTSFSPFSSDGLIFASAPIQNQDPKSLSDEKFAHISQIIEENLPKCDFAKGKDITVILGNTGSGKSTMINMLAKAPMRVDSNGKLVPEFGYERVKVRAGGKACTKFPEVIPGTEIGNLCDLPGFQDTEGAVDDRPGCAGQVAVDGRCCCVDCLLPDGEAALSLARCHVDSDADGPLRDSRCDLGN